MKSYSLALCDRDLRVKTALLWTVLSIPLQQLKATCQSFSDDADAFYDDVLRERCKRASAGSLEALGGLEPYIVFLLFAPLCILFELTYQGFSSPCLRSYKRPYVKGRGKSDGP